YPTSRGPAVFRLTDHISRMFESAKVFLIDIPFTATQIVEAVKDTIRVNGLEQCYIRPIAYLGYGEMGLNPLPCPVNVSIAVWPWGTYLGDEGVRHGVRTKISSWQRHDPNAVPPGAKGTGMYINSSMAKVEALKAGYDEAILLNPQGFVSECTGENIFIVRNGRMLTPPVTAGALEGITQDSVMTIARDLGYDAVVRGAPCRQPRHTASRAQPLEGHHDHRPAQPPQRAAARGAGRTRPGGRTPPPPPREQLAQPATKARPPPRNPTS